MFVFAIADENGIGIPRREGSTNRNASETKIAVFLSSNDALPDDEVTVIVEVYNNSDSAVIVPVVDESSLAYEQVFSADGSSTYSVRTGPTGHSKEMTLAPKSKIASEFLFTVPKLFGALCVRVDGHECVPAAIRGNSALPLAPQKTKNPLSLREVG